MAPAKMTAPYVIDLFAGCGGFSLGAHLAGFQTAAVELDADLSHSYKTNFPRSPLLLADLTAIRSEDLLDGLSLRRSQVAGVIGGPPCQGFSVIGKRAKGDPRNDLVGKFFDFVRWLRPSFFVMENVPGLLSAPFKYLLDEPLLSLSCDYSIFGPDILDAADFGVATKRRRAVVIGLRRETFGTSEINLNRTSRGGVRAVSVAEALGGLPSPRDAWTDDEGDYWAQYSAEASNSGSSFAKWARSGPPAHLGSERIRDLFRHGLISGFQPTLHSREVRQRFARVPGGAVELISKYPRLDWDSPAPTLRAGTGRDRGSYQAARPIHPDENRVITVREAARIQGFPDWFQFHPAKWHSFRMIGNSVSPLFGSSILKTVKAALNQIKNSPNTG